MNIYKVSGKYLFVLGTDLDGNICAMVFDYTGLLYNDKMAPDYAKLVGITSYESYIRFTCKNMSIHVVSIEKMDTHGFGINGD